MKGLDVSPSKGDNFELWGALGGQVDTRGFVQNI